MLIDLQIHSTYSDGYLSPTDVVKFIAKQGVKVAALTDHNTVSGIDEFKHACREHGIKPINGLELYVKYHGWRFNLLWYNFEEDDAELHNLLRDSQVRRRRQVRLALEKILERGFKFDPDKIIDKYNHYVPINRVVDDFIKSKGAMKKIKRDLKIKLPREGEIIGEYFYNKDYGKLHNSFIDLDRIVKLRQRAGGQLVLCHPGKKTGLNREFLTEMKKVGLDGLEKISPHHPYNSIVYIQQLAREFKLIETGGSDFHRFERGQGPVRYSWEYLKVESKLLKDVKKIIGKV